MELHKSKTEFRDTIIATSNYYHLNPLIVEKDYFVTIILKSLKAHIPGILFKGGTSLSKCFKVIKRFSEDIDLTLDTNHFTQGNKRKANVSVLTACDELGFSIQNRDEVEHHSHGNYNCYNIAYPTIFTSNGVKPIVKLEMTFIQKAYPNTIRQITPLIGEYLTAIRQSETLAQFGLDPFEIKVQSLERTFVDKVFALCDYYMRGEDSRQSRHIYDLKKLIDVVEWKKLEGLVSEVRRDRMGNRMCPSAQPSVSVTDVLREIVESNYFKEDYENVTVALLNEDVSYDSVILAISEIAKDSLFKEQ